MTIGLGLARRGVRRVCLRRSWRPRTWPRASTGNGTGWAQVPHHASLVPTTGSRSKPGSYRSSNIRAATSAVVRKNSQSVQRVLQPSRLNDGNHRWVIKTAGERHDGGHHRDDRSARTPGTTSPGPSTTRPSRLYMDGAQIAQRPDLTGPLLNTGSFAPDRHRRQRAMVRLLDNIRLWSVARTQQQIQFDDELSGLRARRT